jgi:hypothetical protein
MPEEEQLEVEALITESDWRPAHTGGTHLLRS